MALLPRVLARLERTLLQLRTIQRTRHWLDGDADACHQWLQTSAR